MVLTPSSMLDLGTKAPDFTLPDTVSDKALSLDTLKSDTATVIAFVCNHCPYVQHIEQAFIHFAKEYQNKGVSIIAISANDAKNYPQDAPDKMKERALEYGYTFPYLYDETQETAKAYKAACTPDFYIFDKDLACVYRGRFDEATPGNDAPVTGKDLRTALDCTLANKPITIEQQPSMGCNIKWRA